MVRSILRRCVWLKSFKAMSQRSSQSFQVPGGGYHLKAGFVAAKPFQCDEAGAGMLDMHMRMVQEQEDNYWRSQFAKEDYYVPGRGYDQYQPAYAMGCLKALQHPGADFQDMEKKMEAEWESNRVASLLPWREVRAAIQAAWEHTSVQILKIEEPTLTPAALRDLSHALRPLHRSCLALVDDLQHIATVPMSDFAQQVLQRHVQMLRNFALALQKSMLQEDRFNTPPGLSGWSHRLHSQWVRFRNRMAEWEPAQVFELCEMRERTLLSAYQRTLRKNLPQDALELLKKQKQQLEINLDKLTWVRHNWSL